jgi:hypothetical protein
MILFLLLSFLMNGSLYALDFLLELKTSLSQFEKINSISAMGQCSERDSKISKGCRSRYEKMYKDPVLNIAVGFGYFEEDAPGRFVNDVPMRVALIQMLTINPCPANISACGFKRNPDDADKLFKEIINPWGKKHRVELSLISGAISADNSLNLNPSNKDRQLKSCENATQQFMNHVKKGDEVVLYVGHSRDGGGPDFCPPKLLPNGHPDYKTYRSQKFGHKRMLEALEQASAAGKTQEIIGMFSCNSKRLFLNAYSQKSKNTGFIMSSGDTFNQDQLKNLFGSIDSVLAQHCEEGFAHSVKHGGLMKIKNMFHQ